MTGKKWFYWLGKLHGGNAINRNRKTWPEWAQRAYRIGWYDSFNQIDW